jgi:hypothetical protein
VISVEWIVPFTGLQLGQFRGLVATSSCHSVELDRVGAREEFRIAVVR